MKKLSFIKNIFSFRKKEVSEVESYEYEEENEEKEHDIPDQQASEEQYREEHDIDNSNEHSELEQKKKIFRFPAMGKAFGVFFFVLFVLIVVPYMLLSLKPEMISCSKWFSISRVPMLSSLPLVKKRKKICIERVKRERRRKRAKQAINSKAQGAGTQEPRDKNKKNNLFENFLDNREVSYKKTSGNILKKGSEKKQELQISQNAQKILETLEKDLKKESEVVSEIQKEKKSELKDKINQNNLFSFSNLENEQGQPEKVGKIENVEELNQVFEKSSDFPKESGIKMEDRFKEQGISAYHVENIRQIEKLLREVLLSEILDLKRDVLTGKEEMSKVVVNQEPLNFSEEQMLKHKIEMEKLMLDRYLTNLKTRTEAIRTILETYVEIDKKLGLSRPEGEIKALAKQIQNENEYRVPKPIKPIEGEEKTVPKPPNEEESFRKMVEQRMLLAEPEAIWFKDGFLWSKGQKGLLNYTLKDIDLYGRRLIFEKEGQQIIINF